MKVVVTGAGGFIGSHLVERLLAVGADVTALLRYDSQADNGNLRFLPAESVKQIRIVRGDVRELETMRKLLAGADAVFHLAALVGIPYSYLHSNEVVEVNTIGTLNVLTAARENGIGVVEITSTSEVYGTARYVPIDESHPKQPQSPYSASKIAADALALSFYHSFGLPVTIGRPFNSYGPRQSERAIIPTITAQALWGEEVHVGSLKPRRDFTFVEDTAEGIIFAGFSAAHGCEINIGSGRDISIGELIDTIFSITGRILPVITESKRARPPDSEVMRLVADNRRAAELACWRPKVSLRQGLERTIEWMAAHRDLFDPGTYCV